MPANTAPSRLLARKRRLLHIYNRLLKHFGPRHWWPADHAWEMMVGAILTQNTNWTNVEKALDSLKSAGALSVQRIANLPRRRLEKLIRPSGFFRQKAERLQRFARHLLKQPTFHRELIGNAVPQPSSGLRTPSPYVGRRVGNEGGSFSFLHLREKLLSMKGIGPETADAMLLYAGGYPIFVVDAYTRRIGQRQGLFRFDDYHQVQSYFASALPKKAALYNEYHALLVQHAKTYCRSRDPLCGDCPVRIGCRFAAKLKKSLARRRWKRVQGEGSSSPFPVGIVPSSRPSPTSGGRRS